MTKTQREILFESHVNGLRELVPGIKDVFVCPICFQQFLPESIKGDLVDVGHVWPRKLCTRSELAKHQQILLCKKCNSTAGHAFDYIAGKDLALYEGSETGNYGQRKVRVFNSDQHGEALILDLHVQNSGENSVDLELPQSSDQNHRLYSERKWRKFEEYLYESPPIGLQVFAPHGTAKRPFGDPKKHMLADASLLTSAYLLAFYCFGYAYVFQTCLDPIREYIKQAFEKEVDRRLEHSEFKQTSVRRCKAYHSDPEIALMLPYDESVPVHQEVAFLHYHIRLPIQEALGEDLRSTCLQDEDESTNVGNDVLYAFQNKTVSLLDHPLLSSLLTEYC